MGFLHFCNPPAKLVIGEIRQTSRYPRLDSYSDRSGVYRGGAERQARGVLACIVDVAQFLSLGGGTERLYARIVRRSGGSPRRSSAAPAAVLSKPLSRSLPCTSCVMDGRY